MEGEMDAVLCDELLQEIFRRLPTTSSAAVSLVSRRWRSLLFSSITTLTLPLPSDNLPLLPSLSSLSSLTLLPHSPSPPLPSDHLLLSLLASPPPRLRRLKFLLGPLSPSFLTSTPPLRNLVSLQLCSLEPLSFRWLLCFSLLSHLSILDCSTLSPTPDDDLGLRLSPETETLRLDSVLFCGIRSGVLGFGWLWRRCLNLRKLLLRNCEGTGDGDDGAVFAACLGGLQQLDLRTCRTIADRILRRVADVSLELETLVLYDGGSREGLRNFISRGARTLRVLDLRLPLDFDDTHLGAVAARRDGLRSLKLQSCCLLTGEGLRRLAQSAEVCGYMEELSLVNCDVVEREMGLLTFVGQSLRRLKRVDLSYNEALKDRELGSMVAACGGRVVELRVRGCKGLSDGVMGVVARWCGAVEELDVRGCAGLSWEGVEAVVGGCRALRKIWVEGSKLTEVSSSLAWRRGIEVC